MLDANSNRRRFERLSLPAAYTPVLVSQLIANQQFLSGGAILDDSGKMIGSTLHVDFPDRVTLEACMQRDPYVTGRVWESVEIRPARFVAV